MLELKNVWIRYGKNVAVRKLTLTVNKGDFVTILGANGAGKSTTINAISGLVKVKRGEDKRAEARENSGQRDYPDS